MPKKWEVKRNRVSCGCRSRQTFFQARIAPFEGNKVLALIHDIGDRMRRSQELLEAKQRAEEADR